VAVSKKRKTTKAKSSAPAQKAKATVGTVFKKAVLTFAPTEKLSVALLFMKEHDFSQVVVRDRRSFALISVDGITRWLQDQVNGKGVSLEIPLSDVRPYEPSGNVVVLSPNHALHDVEAALVPRHGQARPDVFAVIITEDGTSTGTPIGIATPWDFAFRHSPDYSQVTVRNREFHLTERQAKIVRALHQAWENGSPELGQAYILDNEFDTHSGQLRYYFKNSDAWKNLVVQGKRRGIFRLNI